MSSDDTLKAQLQEKEQLVAALTERLELAAEQLDRLQRSGADRGGRSTSSGGFPPELVQKHESLVDDMQAAVEQWNELQAGLVLSRLESQMAELCGRVMSNESGLPSSAQHLDPPDTPNVDSISAGDGEAADEEDKWAALKSYLLEEDDEGTAPDSTVDESAEAVDAPDDSSQSDANEVAGDDPAESLPIAPEEAVGPPAPIAVGETDVTRLRTAIESRDEYIGYLLRKLRYVNSQNRLPANWEEWEGKPETLCRQVEELQAQLTEALRVSELEHSLERARLAREESRVRQMEETARKAMRQLGLNPESDGAEEIETERNAGSGNRWLKMLGICTDDDDDEWAE